MGKSVAPETPFAFPVVAPIDYPHSRAALMNGNAAMLRRLWLAAKPLLSNVANVGLAELVRELIKRLFST